MHHELKTWPKPFAAIRSGEKSYEIREDDREFKVGDSLLLKEHDPHERCGGSGRVWDNGDKTDCGCPSPHGEYTGNQLKVKVVYKTEGGEWGLPDETCVLGIRIEDLYGRAQQPSHFTVCTKKTGVPCYDKATPDEPVFVLRAQDLTSPQVVCEWIRLNIETAPQDKLRQALESALAMASFGKMYGIDGTYETKRKRAD